MIRSCASFLNASPICANWKPAAHLSWNRSAVRGKLTPELALKIANVETKAELEDLYLPYKPKRRTRAEIARERGLAPLAEAILADRSLVPAELAASYITPEVPDVKAALDGARDIIAEGFAENAELIGNLRNYLKDKAVQHSRVIDGKQEAGAKFSDYFDHAERWATVAGHRALAMLRGRNEDFSRSTLKWMPTTRHRSSRSSARLRLSIILAQHFPATAG